MTRTGETTWPAGTAVGCSAAAATAAAAAAAATAAAAADIATAAAAADIATVATVSLPPAPLPPSPSLPPPSLEGNGTGLCVQMEEWRGRWTEADGDEGDGQGRIARETNRNGEERGTAELPRATFWSTR